LDRYRKSGTFSATGLLSPTQIVVLKNEHRDEITMDVSDGMFMLLGNIVHDLLGRTQTDNALQEEELRATVGGIVLSGRPDLLDEEQTLSDFKVTSVWSFLLSDKPDWDGQLNIYAALYRANGFEPKRLQIVGLLRDWTRRRVGEDNYPPAAMITRQIPIWPKALYNKEFVDCTDTERWHRDRCWAVKKRTNKRASKLFHDEEEAEIYMNKLKETKKGDWIIEYRPGESTRCESFCDVSKWCKQYKEIKRQKEAQAA
jgi:hypothetical protein